MSCDEKSRYSLPAPSVMVQSLASVMWSGFQERWKRQVPKLVTLVMATTSAEESSGMAGLSFRNTVDTSIARGVSRSAGK